MNTELRAMSRRRKEAHDVLAASSPVYRAFLEMERAAFADGALPTATKELIALGISVVMNCESCMQWHVEQAARAGADERQVLEAVEVAMEMGGDAVLRASRSGRCEVTRSPPWQAPGGPPRGWGAERLGAGVGVDAAGSRVSGQR